MLSKDQTRIDLFRKVDRRPPGHRLNRPSKEASFPFHPFILKEVAIIIRDLAEKSETGVDLTDPAARRSGMGRGVGDRQNHIVPGREPSVACFQGQGMFSQGEDQEGPQIERTFSTGPCRLPWAEWILSFKPSAAQGIAFRVRSIPLQDR
jgi:hypothetical protein